MSDNNDEGPPGAKRAKGLEPEERSSRSKQKPIDWSLCMFCQKVKHKGVKNLINVSSLGASKVILDAAITRDDKAMILNITGKDLIATKAKYHSACRANYVSKSNLKVHTFQEENEEEECAYSAAFENLLKEIVPGISEGKVYDMSYLLERYKAALSLKGNASYSSYRSEKLKKRLINHFNNRITFQKQSDPSKPELIYSSEISVKYIIEKAFSEKCENYNKDTTPEASEDEEEEKVNLLFHAAEIIKQDIRACNGICIQPLSVDDISLEKGRSLIPESLHKLLSFIFTKPEKKGTKESKNNPSDVERRVVMICQDIIHAASNSRVKTPKHVGLAVTLHHITGSKELITMLNRMGYCSSYDDVELVNTAWAREMTVRSQELGVLLPSNISPGAFVQFAADNNDLNEETLDGKETTHATTLVAYQRQQYGPKLPPKLYADHSKKQRSLNQVAQGQVIQECSVGGKRPAVTSFLNKIDDNYFLSQESSECIDQRELSWFLLRLNQRDVLEPCTSEDRNEDQSVPGWSAFNAMMSPVVAPRTIIGYCPIIAGSPTEYSTIYTVLKTVQEMTKSLGQSTGVVTFDLAIYIKAKEIQWRYPDEFKHLVIRMGGFHIALNFLSVIGKKFQESGLEDILIESGLYGSNSTSALLQGKSYNRGVRAHKLVMEALLRLKWEAFCSWVKQDERANFDQLNDIVSTYKAGSSSERKAAYHMLCNTIGNINSLLKRFQQQATSSKLFKFWDSYINMVLLLLKFIRAEREGDWKQHLKATAEMIPHFFSMDRVNYSRWLPVYISDMYQLEETAPDIHNEFMSGNHAVSRSSQPFNQVWTDMALEQTVNRDSKTKGGIIGISQRPGALEKWFLTAHERAATTTATKGMCGIGEVHDIPEKTHKEFGKARIQRDEDDIKKVISTLKTVMSNPFSIETTDDDVPLSNLATGVVMPDDLSNRLLKAESLGTQEMKSFVKKRMHTNEVGFWEPLSKMNIKTFASLSKKAKVKSGNEKFVTVSADRNLFGRLLIASKSRDINLKEVLRYELTSVPCALAHADGSLRKTTKSVLLDMLEEEVQIFSRLPVGKEELSTAHLIDGMAVVQMMRNAGSATFGELARKYFDVITFQLGKGGCNRVDVIFDRYDKEDSIKEGERDRRGSSSSYEIRISGPGTPIPKKWTNFISNPTNKTNLKVYLSDAWREMAKAQLKPGEELVLAGCFSNSDHALLCTRSGERPLHHLLSDHEEADTRLVLHAQDCSRNNHHRIVVQSPDTDVAVLCIYAYNQIACEELWFRTGVKDKLRFIPVHRLARKMGNDLCTMLPAFHALTGCDTTSGLFQIGKKKAWKALLNNKLEHHGISSLGEEIPPRQHSVQSAEAFISSLYAPPARAGTTANDARYWVFCQKHQRNEGNPPTSDSIHLHIKRANYQAMIWRRCLQAIQDLPSPIDNGWEKRDGILKPLLMSQAPAPEGLVELTVCKCQKSSCKSTMCVCRVNELSCTEACGCMADECENPHTGNIVIDEVSDDEDEEFV